MRHVHIKEKFNILTYMSRNILIRIIIKKIIIICRNSYQYTRKMLIKSTNKIILYSIGKDSIIESLIFFITYKLTFLHYN